VPRDPRARILDREAEAGQPVVEEQAMLHAVAAAAVCDEFVVDGAGVEGDVAGPNIFDGKIHHDYFPFLQRTRKGFPR
jgi:hypothetical protein